VRQNGLVFGHEPSLLQVGTTDRPQGEVMVPSITLGRDGVGSTEEEFTAWVEFVCKHIDNRCGFEVNIDVAYPKDVQTDKFSYGWDYKILETMESAILNLWEEFCEQPTCDLPQESAQP